MLVRKSVIERNLNNRLALVEDFLKYWNSRGLRKVDDIQGKIKKIPRK